MQYKYAREITEQVRRLGAVTLIPSETPGHHLLVDHRLTVTWDCYGSATLSLLSHADLEQHEEWVGAVVGASIFSVEDAVREAARTWGIIFA